MQQYHVQINGKALEVTLIRKSPDQIEFLCNNSSYVVSLSPVERAVQASVHPVAIASPTAQRAPAQSLAPPGSITAPMPGRVVSIPVTKGDVVSAGDTLIVIEAMKMENALPSPVAGKVQEVHIAEGSEVNGGQLLLTISADA